MATTLKNYIAGDWKKSQNADMLTVDNPATQDTLAYVPIGESSDVDTVVQAAKEAFPAWRNTPANERVQYLFKLKHLLEENIEDIAKTITIESGKTYKESIGEMRRAIENVEVACGTPLMLQSEFSEDIARGIDEYMIRQPLGVCAAICPFNFPGMITFWFLPYAIACGEYLYRKAVQKKVPLTMAKNL